MVRIRLQRVAIVGGGYAGLCTAVALAKLGHPVTCIDSDREKVRAITEGRPPFYEKNLAGELAALVKRGLLVATGETAPAVRDAQTIFICVGTPSKEDGSLDPSQIQCAAAEVGEGINRARKPLVVVKSTVVPGTTEALVIPLIDQKSGLSSSEYRICVNPEFLQEGRALQDSFHPHHIVIGQRDPASGNALERLLREFNAPIMRTSLRTAEAIKYATNAFLATKVTFANEMANVCGRLGIDADEVLRGMSMDPRINPQFLVPGAGFGGSCLSKDLRAMVRLAASLGYSPTLFSTILEFNDRQPEEVVQVLQQEIGTLRGKRIALLGLAFKAGTDDVRETRALPIAEALTRAGAKVLAYDPVAGAGFVRLGAPAQVVSSVSEALTDADGCIIQASWPEFRKLGAREFGLMRSPVVVDGRRTWPVSKIPRGIRYRRIG